MTNDKFIEFCTDKLHEKYDFELLGKPIEIELLYFMTADRTMTAIFDTTARDDYYYICKYDKMADADRKSVV